MTEPAVREKRWPFFSRRFVLALALLSLAEVGSLGTRAVSAQVPVPPGAQRATRTELTARLSQVEQSIAAAGGRGKEGVRLEAEAQSLRRRLEEGDFRAGDRFLITLSQDAAQRSDTASVRDSLLVSLAGLPDLSLRGTLRSELNEKLGAHVARFLRNSSVRTLIFTRLAILGAVGSPGYYSVPPDRPMSDVLMMAGGAAKDANLGKLEVKRGGSVILSSKAANKAITEGRTLEQLDLQSGDELRIPAKRKASAQAIVQIMFFASTIFFAAINFIRFYYSQQQP